MKLESQSAIVTLTSSGLCKQTYDPRQYPMKDVKGMNENSGKEENMQESPLKKRLNARKEAARMQQLAAEGGLIQDKASCKPFEKYMEALKVDPPRTFTDKYFTESQKKIEPFIGGGEVTVEEKGPIANTNNNKKSTDLVKPDQALISKLLANEKDERYHYLIKNGTVTSVEPETNTIFVQLPQIPNVTIAYRRPLERSKAGKQFILTRRKLPAIPLFEGEELLEELDLSYNVIMRLENLVSLPKLTFLNLSYNMIIQMTNMNTLQGLKTLNLSHNNITTIEGLDYLKALEILNLEANHITKIAGLSHLNKLLVLILNENKIESLDGIEPVITLKELYIKNNVVSDLAKLSTLPRLELLDASHNSITKINKEVAGKLKSLRAFHIDQNPCFTDPETHKMLNEAPIKGATALRPAMAPLKNLADALNYAKNVEASAVGKTVVKAKELDGQYTTDQLETIGRIREDWKSEQGKSSEIPRRFFAIVENKTTLHLFGAAALDSLTTSGYESTITEIIFECIKFEHIVYPPVMAELKKYTLLNAVTLISNGLASFVLLSKLEGLDRIKKLTIKRNPICGLTTLNAFIAYRFQHVTEINGKPVAEKERKIAKQEFEKFDRSLASATLANKKHLSYKKLGCSKAGIKAIAKEYEISANKFAGKVQSEGETIYGKRKSTEKELETYIADFVYDYVSQLHEGSDLYEDM